MQRINWKVAILAGLIAGLVLSMFPRVSPWSGWNFFTPVILGRTFAPGTEPGFFTAFLIQLALGGLYGLLIAPVVHRFHHARAIAMGGLAGLGLYFLNLAVTRLVAPHMNGSESVVLFTHVFFGLVAAAAYKGLARQPAPPAILE